MRRDRARPLYRQFPDDHAQLRFHWLQGRIALALEQLDEAISILRQVQEELRARDQHLDFLLVSIDLAEAHVAAGEIVAAERRLAEVTPLLASWTPLRRNAAAAWLIFQQQLDQRRDESAPSLAPLFVRLRLYYRRYWNVSTAELSAR